MKKTEQSAVQFNSLGYSYSVLDYFCVYCVTSKCVNSCRSGGKTVSDFIGGLSDNLMFSEFSCFSVSLQRVWVERS